MSNRKFTIDEALKTGHATPTRKTNPKNPTSSKYSPHVVAVDFSPSDLERVKNDQEHDEATAKAAQEARAKIEAAVEGGRRTHRRRRRRQVRRTRRRRSTKSRK